MKINTTKILILSFIGGIIIAMLLAFDFLLTANYLRFSSIYLGNKHLTEPIIFTLSVFVFFWMGAFSVRIHHSLNSTVKDAVIVSTVTGIIIGILWTVEQFIILVYELKISGANYVSSMSLLLGGLSCIPFRLIFYLPISIAGGIFYLLLYGNKKVK